MTKSNETYINITKNEIQLVKSLKSTHGRKKNSAYVVEAIKNVEELFSSEIKIKIVYLSEKLSQEKSDNFKNLCWQKEIPFKIFHESEYDKITTMNNPEGVMAICDFPEGNKLSVGDIVLPAIYLSEVNDPGNLGTILRTANWFGIKTILTSTNSVDAYNPKVIRSSMGSFFTLQIIQNIEVDTLVDFTDKNKIHLYSADMKGENPVTFTPNSKFIVCFGSESHGVPEKILNNSANILSIPKFGAGESLNLGMSVGIILNSLINKG